MARGIDHLVIAVRDLDAARDDYEHLGFTMTPIGRQPFGTANHLVQLEGCFIELVGVVDPGRVVPMSDGHFSFSAQVERAVGAREGMCMLVLTTADARADADEWRARGLEVYEPFHWSRPAILPDGSETTVAFTLSFATDPAMPDIAFFTCQQHNPEMFWKPEYQAHENGARSIAEVTLVAGTPAGHGAFLSRLIGGADPLEEAGGILVPTDAGDIRVQTPAAFAARFPDAAPVDAASGPRFAAATVRVEDPERAAGCLDRGGVSFSRGDGGIYLSQGPGRGLVLELAGP